MEKPWYNSTDTDENNKQAEEAYKSMMTITLKKPNNQKYTNFSKEVIRRAEQDFPDYEYGEEEVRQLLNKSYVV